MKRAATLLIAGLAFGGAAAAAPSAAATTVSGCTFGYSVGSQWTGGYTAQLTVNYSMSTPTVGWTIGFDFVQADQHVTAGWTGTTTQSGRHVTFASYPFATALQPAIGSISVGFTGSYSTTNPPPTNVTFDGVPCSGFSTIV